MVIQESREADPVVADVLPPGLARRRALRAAGTNVSLHDFTAEEREARGFGSEHGL